MKKVFLEISQNSQENTCDRVSFLIKLTLAQVFPVNFAKFLRTPFFIEYLWWLLLKVLTSYIDYVMFMLISNESIKVTDFKN